MELEVGFAVHQGEKMDGKKKQCKETTEGTDSEGIAEGASRDPTNPSQGLGSSPREHILPVPRAGLTQSVPIPAEMDPS